MLLKSFGWQQLRFFDDVRGHSGERVFKHISFELSQSEKRV